jgi:hypothetical protein
MLRGIFTTYKAFKDVIIKRQEVILRNLLAEPLEEFDKIKVELVDPSGSITAKELAYFQMGEAGSSNAPHSNNNDKNDDDESNYWKEE